MSNVFYDPFEFLTVTTQNSGIVCRKKYEPFELGKLLPPIETRKLTSSAHVNLFIIIFDKNI